MVFFSPTKREFSQRTARELSELYHWSRGEHAAARFWREVLTDEEQTALGGNFRAAYLDCEGMVGMYAQLVPGLTFERALLEVMRKLGWLPEAKYDRLVQAIGEPIALPPSRGAQPHWDRSRATLSYGGQPIRQIRQPGRAVNIVAILEAFERLEWPTVVPLTEIAGLSPHKRHQTIYDLNEGLKGIRFGMNGSGDGIVWVRADA
jgi:hypothetical protein